MLFNPYPANVANMVSS